MKKKICIIAIVIIVLMIVTVVLSLVHDVRNDLLEEQESRKILENIAYSVPDVFEKTEYIRGTGYHYYKNYKSCSFEVKYHDNYDNFNNGGEYLRDKIEFTLNDIVGELKEVDINGYKWYVVDKKGDSRINYYYATIYDEKIYYMEYEIYDYNNGDHDGNDNFCEAYYGEIISSVKFK